MAEGLGHEGGRHLPLSLRAGLNSEVELGQEAVDPCHSPCNSEGREKAQSRGVEKRPRDPWGGRSLGGQACHITPAGSEVVLCGKCHSMDAFLHKELHCTGC